MRICLNRDMDNIFITKDSNKKQVFESGARRDDQSNKLRFDLIPVCALKRLAALYQRGAEKYGEGNYEKGMPFTRVFASLFRHLIAWREGENTEDHLSAIAWNAFSLMHYEELIEQGILSKELDDREIQQEETSKEIAKAMDYGFNNVIDCNHTESTVIFDDYLQPQEEEYDES